MANLMTVRLSKADSTPWGFRLQGGKDFGQPLLIQKVNGGSLAERAGLQVGDALVKVNNTEVFNMRHKEAQDALVKAGNSFELTVQRGGGGVWRPNVTAVGAMPAPGGASPGATVTRTSLAKPRGPPTPAPGSGHNLSPRPFASTPQMNGGDSVKAIVNKQYNTPVGMYSEETIAETLSAQAEVLAGGVLGVNFKKNERTYDSQKSEVFKMVQEVDKEPKTPEPDDSQHEFGSGLRHVVPPQVSQPQPQPPSQPLAPGQNICADCERLIVGVFVRIKDKNLHVECFKCATCGTSLKNVGYYNINNKLYCDIHAKMVARQNPPSANLDPITIPPGGRIPSGAISVPSPAPQSPQASTLGPMPFHTQAPAGPKPFGNASIIQPPSSVPFSVPAAPISAPTMPKPQNTEEVHSFVWPPPNPQPSGTSNGGGKRLSVCSEEVCNWSRKTGKQVLIEEEPIRPASPVPGKVVKVIEASARRVIEQKSQKTGVVYSGLELVGKPHEIKSLLPPASAVRPMSPAQVVVFPPELPAELPRSRTATPRIVDKEKEGEAVKVVEKVIKRQEAKEQVEGKLEELTEKKKEEPEKNIKKVDKEVEKVNDSEKKSTEPKEKEACEVEKVKEKKVENVKESKSVKEKVFTKTEVENIVKEELQKMLNPAPKAPAKQYSIKDLPKPIIAGGAMASALCTAPDRPFSPIQPPAAVIKPPTQEPYVPLPKGSAPPSTLITAPARPFSPVQPPTSVSKPAKQEPFVPLPKPSEPYFPPPPPHPEQEPLPDRAARALREVGCRSPMTDALTVAPERPYSPLVSGSITSKSKKSVTMLNALTVAPSVPFTMPGKTPIPSETPRGAFKPVSSSNASVVPKPSPLSQSSGSGTSSTSNQNNGNIPVVHQASKYYPIVSQIPQPIHKTLTINNPPTEKPQFTGRKKELEFGKGFHGSTAKIEVLKTVKQETISKTAQSGLQCPNVPFYQQGVEQLRAVSPKPIPYKAPQAEPITKTETSRKSSFQAAKEVFDKPNIIPLAPLLPYYQQNIGEIPIRDRSISPVPHVIRAPSLNPPPSSRSTPPPSKTHRPSPLVGPSKIEAQGSKQAFKPQVHTSRLELHEKSMKTELISENRTERCSSPWKASVRTVQNLSPFEVRLPSPRPHMAVADTPRAKAADPPAAASIPPGVQSLPSPGGKSGSVAGSTAPRRGRGVLNTSVAPGGRIPVCGQCNNQIRGPFITALGKIWCPDHFVCVNAKCRRPLQDIGFVEEAEGLYCEYCFEQYLAPVCSKCNSKIKGDCLNAIGKQFHPECFCCAYCGKLFGNNPFFLEDALPYCENDWNELFTTKCFSCGFPIEAGDRWVEALNNNYHSQCFSCTMCKKNLEGQSFYAKGGRPFCKNHAR